MYASTHTGERGEGERKRRWEGGREGGRERNFKMVLQMWLLPAEPEDLNAILEPHDGRRETTLPSYSQTPARTWRSVCLP